MRVSGLGLKEMWDQGRATSSGQQVLWSFGVRGLQAVAVTEAEAVFCVGP